MRKVIFTTLSIIILSFTCSAQEEKTDTVKLKSDIVNPLENMRLRFEEFDFYRDKYQNIQIQTNKDTNTLQLWTEMIIKSVSGKRPDSNGADFYFLSPLYNKFLEESKFNPVKYVLGMAQLSAVGYLAYKHIKKYGFIY
jgi:hypothetical protein